VRIFKVKTFARWAKAEHIGDADLVKTIQDAEAGLIDAFLGGELIKKRLARQGQGKSSGYRVIIAFRSENRSFFLEGFGKNDKENISNREKEALKKYAAALFNMDDNQIRSAVKKGIFQEVKADDTEKKPHSSECS